jgi:hypothetical protein
MSCVVVAGDAAIVNQCKTLGLSFTTAVPVYLFSVYFPSLAKKNSVEEEV